MISETEPNSEVVLPGDPGDDRVGLAARGPSNSLADDVWRQLSTLVIDNKDTWRRAVVERTGLPFSRIRIVKRLARGSMTVKQIAEAATIDAPAATVAVNDLEQRGLVVRRIDPDNRRSKMVSLTDDGRELVAAIDAVDDPAPEVLTRLGQDELKKLRGVLELMAKSPSTADPTRCLD